MYSLIFFLSDSRIQCLLATLVAHTLILCNSNIVHGTCIFFCSIQDTKGVTTRRSKDYVDVCFHAIFSPAMFNNLETDKVCIIFDHVTLGSWKKKYQMKVVQ